MGNHSKKLQAGFNTLRINVAMLALTYTNKDNRSARRHGFTLSEILVSMAISTIVMTGASITFSMGVHAYRNSAANMDASAQCSTSLFRITRGIGNSCGLRAAIIPVYTSSSDDGGWDITFKVPSGLAGNDTQVNKLRYDKDTKTILFQDGSDGDWSVIGKNISNSTITATKDSASFMIQAQSVIGNKTTTNEMRSTVAFRN